MEWTYGGKEEKKEKRKRRKRGLPIGESVWNGRGKGGKNKGKGKGKRRKWELPLERLYGLDVLRKGGKEMAFHHKMNKFLLYSKSVDVGKIYLFGLRWTRFLICSKWIRALKGEEANKVP